MVYYPSFFTPLESVLMNQQLIKQVSGTTSKGMNISTNEIAVTEGGHYANICYTILVFIIIAGYIDIIAYGMHNADKINNDPGMNMGITGFQLVLGSIIIFLAHIEVNIINCFFCCHFTVRMVFTVKN